MKGKLLAVCMAAALLLAGCGGGGSTSGGSTANSAPSASGNWADVEDSYWEMPSPMEQQEAGTSSIYQDPGAKLIRRAELNIQTEQFDQSVEALNRLVADCGGYFELASVYGGSSRDANAARWGEYTIRIPAERYDQFFTSTGDLGYITSKNESSENVGEQYYDIEARLKTQRTKQERLLALLEKAETMEDIISLENALSNVEYEIELYSSDLNRYDALINFATFQVYLNEVGRVTREVGETDSLGARMAAGFQSSFRGLVQGGQNLLIWMSYNLFLTVILAAVAVTAVLVGRRELKKRSSSEEKKE